MSKLKQHRQSKSNEDKNILTSTSAFMETPSTSISQTRENQLNNLNDQQSSQTNHQLNDWHEHINGFHDEKSRFIQEHADSRTQTKNKLTDANRIQNDKDDDWVCPVAIALRRAGYDVPLRPSKSWLERDRKKQATLRKRQRLFKEV